MNFPRCIPLLLAPCALLLAGCGVRFHDPPDGTEFFKSLAVTGDMHAGSPLSAVISMAQNYPVPVDVQCELRQGKQLVKQLGKDQVVALENGTPKATPFAAAFSFDFSVETPGHYKAECFTPYDEDNYILEEFDIGPARPSPTPAG